MTYCATQTKLLASAGKELAEKLLPAPFKLWYSNHDTGIQMTIVGGEGWPALYVWRGSIWHYSRYEFNDKDHIPGLQPDFEFARPVIDKYFADIAAAVEERNARAKALHDARAVEAKESRRSAIEAIKKQVA